MLKKLFNHLFNKKKKGETFTIECPFCRAKAKSELSYFYGCGIAHIDAECKECGAVWDYDDRDIGEA